MDISISLDISEASAVAVVPSTYRGDAEVADLLDSKHSIHHSRQIDWVGLMINVLYKPTYTRRDMSVLTRREISYGYMIFITEQMMLLLQLRFEPLLFITCSTMEPVFSESAL